MTSGCGATGNAFHGPSGCFVQGGTGYPLDKLVEHRVAPALSFVTYIRAFRIAAGDLMLASQRDNNDHLLQKRQTRRTAGLVVLSVSERLHYRGNS